jgi:hypothetical protein
MSPCFTRACLLITVFCTASAIADGSVVQSGSPTFPLQVDRAVLTLRCGQGKTAPPRTVSLPVSLFAELRDNIDTMFTYADALRRRRPELAGAPEKACLSFEYMGVSVLRMYFPCGRFESGRLESSEDRYPFVAVLTKGFTARLKKLIKPGPR